MKTRVAKSITGIIAQSILWSLILAAIASVLVYVVFGALSGEFRWIFEGELILLCKNPTGTPRILCDGIDGNVALAFMSALIGGLVVWPCYFYTRPKLNRRNQRIWLAAGWIGALTIWGGISGFLIGTPFALASSVITFGLYELSTRVRFARNKQDKGYRLVRL